MTVRIKISDAMCDKYPFATEYAASCGYTFIDEFKAIDFVAMRSCFSLTSIEIQEIKKYLEDCENGFIGLITSNGENLQSVSKGVCFKNNDTEALPKGSNSTITIRNNVKIKREYIQTKNRQQLNYIKNISTNKDVDHVNEIAIDEANNVSPTEKRKCTMFDAQKISLSALHKQSINNKYLFLDSSIDELELSVRAMNALSEAKIKTISQFLLLTEKQLYKMKNVGKKTVGQILAVISVLKNMGLSESSAPYISHNHKLKIRNEVGLYIRNIILGEPQNNNYCEICQSDVERKLIMNIYEAKEILGADLTLTAYMQSEKIQPLIMGFDEFIYKTNMTCDVINRCQKVPELRLKNQLEGYLKAFRMDDFEFITTLFDCSRAEQMLGKSINGMSFTVEDLISLVEKGNLNISIIKFLNVFLNNLGYDLTLDLRNILNNLKNGRPREYNVLVRHSNGETLESISKSAGLTRERIRQIEAKSIQRIIPKLNRGKDPLTLISADFNFVGILTHEKIIEYFNDELLARIFIHIELQKGAGSKYFIYDRELNAFIYKENFAGRKIDFSDLPSLIFEDELEEHLSRLAQNQRHSLEKVKIWFAKSGFKKKGKVYCLGRLTNQTVYGYVLKHFYPSGIKLYDANETQNFRQKVLDIFDDINLPESNRAIDAAIAKIAILYDRGMYIHSSYVQIRDDMISEIDSFIQNNERTAISFNEIFEKFNKKLQLKSNIHNRYFLQGVLKDRLTSEYYFSRDYISKEQLFSIGDDIEAFIKENGRIHKSQIFEKFIGLTDIVLAMKTAANKNIISLDNGEFMHSNLLNIIEDDYNIESYIASQVVEYPISSRKLIEDMYLICPEFLIRNNITTHSELFGVLRYMFDEKFKFSRPFMAKVDADEVSNLKVLKQYLEEYDTLAIEDLVGICEDNHIHFLSWRNTIRDLNTDFLRINAYTLSRYEEEILDDDILQGICASIKDDIGTKGYVAGHKLFDFMMYPEIGFTWNAFLLRSIIEKYLNEQIIMIEMPTTDIYAMGTIFTSSDCECENYIQLLESVLKNEHNRESFQSVDEAINWLKQEGLFIGKPPKCLTNGQLITVDEYGSILV